MARSFKHLTQLTPYLPYLGLLVVAILVFVGLGLYTLPSAVRSFPERFANSSASFTMYYADWCGHCQTAKPEFSEFAKQGILKIGNKECKIRMISPENEPDAAAGKPIKGFPTFLMETTDGKVVEYKGERTTAGFLEFINKNLG
jgi:thiol-disulfide isomerase/thioredoxin